MPDAYRVVDRIQDQSDFDSSWTAASSTGFPLVWNDGTGLWTPMSIVISANTISATAPASGAGNPLTLSGSAAVSGNTNGGDTIVQLTAKSGSGANGKMIVKSASVAQDKMLDFYNHSGTSQLSVRYYASLDTTYLQLEHGYDLYSGIVFGTSNQRGMWVSAEYGDIVFNTIASAVRPVADNTAGVTLGSALFRWAGLYVCSSNIILSSTSTVGQKIQLASGTPTADALQVTLSDGVTTLAGIDATGRIYGDGSLLTNLPATSPGGSSGQLQYNNAGAFGGISALTYTASPLNITFATGDRTGDSSAFYLSATGASGASGTNTDMVRLQGTYSAGHFNFIRCIRDASTIAFKVDSGGNVVANGGITGNGGYIYAANYGTIGGAGTNRCGTGYFRYLDIASASTSAVPVIIKLASGTPTADAFQITLSDGTTEIFDINKNGNPRVASTVFFEDTNGYITRTSATNTMDFSPSGAASVLKLTANNLDVLVSGAIRLRTGTDSTDGEVCTANKGGNSGTGLGLLVHAGNGSTGGTPTAGGTVKVYGGSGAAGNTNGGAAYVYGGAKFGSGVDGDVYLGYNGSAKLGTVYGNDLLAYVIIEANTDGSGSPNILTAAESRKTLTNEGATAENYHTLPTAAAGIEYQFICQDSDGIRVTADTGDTIRDVGTVSASAGYIRSSTVGSVIRLLAINATEWIVVSKQGTWTIDS